MSGEITPNPPRLMKAPCSHCGTQVPVLAIPGPQLASCPHCKESFQIVLNHDDLVPPPIRSPRRWFTTATMFLSPIGGAIVANLLYSPGWPIELPVLVIDCIIGGLAGWVLYMLYDFIVKVRRGERPPKKSYTYQCFCGVRIKYDDEEAGTQILCGACARRIDLPNPKENARAFLRQSWQKLVRWTCIITCLIAIRIIWPLSFPFS